MLNGIEDRNTSKVLGLFASATPASEYPSSISDSWNATHEEIPSVATGAAVESTMYESFSREIRSWSETSFIAEPTIAVLA